MYMYYTKISSLNDKTVYFQNKERMFVDLFGVINEISLRENRYGGVC